MPRPARPGLLWFAPSYGYGRHFMYFGEIFRHLALRVERMAVAVEKGREFDNPYAIDLRPIVRFARLRNVRLVGGVDYDASLAIADPRSGWALRRLRPDVVVLIEFGTLSLLATIATMGTGTARLLLIEGDSRLRGGRTTGLALLLKRWIARRAHWVQTNNADGARFAVEALGVSPTRLTVAPYLTSCPPEMPAAVSPAETTDPLGRPVRLLFANSLTERKNVALILDALASTRAEVRRRIALTIVGDGPERQRLEAAASVLDLAGPVHFTGGVAYRELGAWYGWADILAVPSRADYRSLSGFEGLGFGLALLSSAGDGASAETVVEGVNGFVLPPDDIAAWAEAISTLVEDRARLARMREASRARYAAHFSLERIAANVADCAANARREARA